MVRTGKVYLVGAGPGDPGLITLRGAECLRRADTVLYDYLVNPRILELVPAGVELVCLGQHGRSRIWPQDEINSHLVRCAQAGRRVVRLKGGDPCVFARVSDEMRALAEAGIPFEIVPGVTAALAAASYAAIPLTHREHASAVALVTGQEDLEKHEATLDYQALSHFPGTLVFYMGVTTARRWAQQLIQAGKPAQTPVAIVRRCSFPDQKVIRCTLADLPDLVERTPRLRPPAIVIVGSVVDAATPPSWFETRPLFGRRILVTRAADQSAQLAQQLEELGGETIFQPAIEIVPPDDWTDVDQALASLTTGEWVVFSSSNGVRFILNRLLSTGGDLRRLGGVKLAAIGPGTAEALHEFHLRADAIPDEFRAESLASLLSSHASGKRFLLVRASRGREVLAEQLCEAGGIVKQVVAYQSRDVTQPDPAVSEQLAAGEIDCVTVTSSAIARSLVKLFGENLRRSRLVTISPITSATLKELGFDAAAEAEPYTMAGVVDAVRKLRVES